MNPWPMLVTRPSGPAYTIGVTIKPPVKFCAHKNNHATKLSCYVNSRQATTNYKQYPVDFLQSASFTISD